MTGRAIPEAAVVEALAQSHFKALPRDTIVALMEGATRAHWPAASTVRAAGQTGPHLDLLIDGLLRISVGAPDGRSLTVRYLRPGGVAGVVSLFTPDYATPGTIQAIVDSDVLTLRAREVIDLSERDLLVARALIDELSERVVQFVAEIPGNIFSTVRQRVARHLLDLASEQHQGGRLVARISQQALADATGSVREVVVRVLRDLREEGVIETGRGGIEVLLPDRLDHRAVPDVEVEDGHRCSTFGPMSRDRGLTRPWTAPWPGRRAGRASASRRARC